MNFVCRFLRRTWWMTFSTILVVIVGAWLFTFGIDRRNIDEQTFHLIQHGMSKTEVESLLGGSSGAFGITAQFVKEKVLDWRKRSGTSSVLVRSWQLPDSERSQIERWEVNTWNRMAIITIQFDGDARVAGARYEECK